MQTNLEKHRGDLEKLIMRGEALLLSFRYQNFPSEIDEAYGKLFDKEKWKGLKDSLPQFETEYQDWYSEARSAIKQLLPDRLNDFIRHYEKPKSRKAITYENYVIEDALQGLNVTRGWQKEKVVGPDAAIPQLEQQVSILKSVQKRFESSLFDIKQMAQADLFDSELDAARELRKNGFLRAAGAVAGVVLEKHLSQVLANHAIQVKKKNPAISDLNDLLKTSGIVEIPQWRSVQHLGDLRNLCDHDKKKEPSPDEIYELIGGVEKVTKTLF